MDNINDCIARAIEAGRPRRPERVVCARTCMTTKLTTLHPESTLMSAMEVLLRHEISGAPVVEGHMRLVGMLSEIDCLRALASGSYDHAPFRDDQPISKVMSTKLVTVDPSVEVFTMVHLFEHHGVRRLPVVEQGVLVGQVSRRDVLRALTRL